MLRRHATRNGPLGAGYQSNSGRPRGKWRHGEEEIRPTWIGTYGTYGPTNPDVPVLNGEFKLSPFQSPG
ncbi:hypothetical protein BC2230_90039 [Burkholderia cepacia]